MRNFCRATKNLLNVAHFDLDSTLWCLNGPLHFLEHTLSILKKCLWNSWIVSSKCVPKGRIFLMNSWNKKWCMCRCTIDRSHFWLTCAFCCCFLESCQIIAIGVNNAFDDLYTAKIWRKRKYDPECCLLFSLSFGWHLF